MLLIAVSTKGIKRLSKKERAEIFLPDEIKDILIGILLGDGHIVRRSSTSNSRLVYAQTAIEHKEYFNKVYYIFKPYCAENFIPKPLTVIDKRTNKKYILFHLQLCNYHVLIDLKIIFINQM